MNRIRDFLRLGAIVVGVIVIALMAREAHNYAMFVREQRHDATEQTIWKLVAEIKQIAMTNALPANEEELQIALKKSLPLDGWGKPVHYHWFGTNRFTVTAFSPWPEVLVFQYDSVYSPAAIEKYLF